MGLQDAKTKKTKQKNNKTKQKKVKIRLKPKGYSQGKKHHQLKLQRLQRVRIRAFRSLVHQIKFL